MKLSDLTPRGAGEIAQKRAVPQFQNTARK